MRRHNLTPFTQCLISERLLVDFTLQVLTVHFRDMLIKIFSSFHVSKKEKSCIGCDFKRLWVPSSFSNTSAASISVLLLLVENATGIYFICCLIRLKYRTGCFPGSHDLRSSVQSPFVLFHFSSLANPASIQHVTLRIDQ